MQPIHCYADDDFVMNEIDDEINNDSNMLL